MFIYIHVKITKNEDRTSVRVRNETIIKEKGVCFRDWWSFAAGTLFDQ